MADHEARVSKGSVVFFLLSVLAIVFKGLSEIVPSVPIFIAKLIGFSLGTIGLIYVLGYVAHDMVDDIKSMRNKNE